jgi:hypothetical protein
MEINVMTGCPGVVGDGVHDDGPYIQECIDQNPGKHIVLPKTRSGSATGTSPDYFSSQTITLNGDSMWLSGAVPARFYSLSTTTAAVQISFDPNNPGPGVMIPFDCYSCKVSDLYLLGNNCWVPDDLTTYDPPEFTTSCPSSSTPTNCAYTVGFSAYGRDGMLVAGGEPTVERVAAGCFERHGFALIGDSSAECGPDCNETPDDWSLTDDFAYDNRGFGVLLIGSDSGVGSSFRFQTQYNQLGSIGDYTHGGNQNSHSDSSGYFLNKFDKRPA